MIVSPSLLAADFANLQRDVEMLNSSRADWFHVDVMDGLFVPSISFGMPVLKAIGKYAKKPLDVHLMIVDPDRYIKAFADLGSRILTVHYEACTHLHRTLQAIKQEGMMTGIAINPHTSVSLLEPILQDIDVICLMSVNPGFGGQKFIEYTYRKLTDLKNRITNAGVRTLIEIDGGVSLENFKNLKSLGADIIVSGSSIFASKDPVAVIETMKS